jgi:hypothetical protein
MQSQKELETSSADVATNAPRAAAGIKKALDDSAGT